VASPRREPPGGRVRTDRLLVEYFEALLEVDGHDLACAGELLDQECRSRFPALKNWW
jgi:hypothetical protein